MNRSPLRSAPTLTLALALALVTLPAPASAEVLTLHDVLFPEGRSVNLEMVPTSRAPIEELRAKIIYKRGQAKITIKSDILKPAVLFGGDVTCYVLWAVSRGGELENLGELRISETDTKEEFQSGLKSFALIVTAEAYYQVSGPSEMVIFYSGEPEKDKISSFPYPFAEFAVAPAHETDDISKLRWQKDTSLDLLQAEKAFELAGRHGAEVYAPVVYRDARVALAQATNLTTKTNRRRMILDYTRRVVALSNDAIGLSLRRQEADRLEEQISARKAEMVALEERVTEAEQGAESARLLAAQAAEARAKAEAESRLLESSLLELRSDRQELEAASSELRSSLETLKNDKAALERSSATLGMEMKSLQAEKEALAASAAALEGEMATLRTEKAQLARSASDLQLEMSTIQAEKARLETSARTLEAEMTTLRTERGRLEAETAKMESDMTALRTEKAALEGRLHSALSLVANTVDSARGLIVNLPDILFDVNESTLKPEAEIVLAKMAGILLIMNDLGLEIEGHTDSSGGREHNQALSERRARAVETFLSSNGLDADRMKALGYGPDRPAADNSTKEGRSKNRRVEIVISRGSGEGPAATD